MSKYKEMGIGLHLFVTDDPRNLWRLCFVSLHDLNNHKLKLRPKSQFRL